MEDKDKPIQGSMITYIRKFLKLFLIVFMTVYLSRLIHKHHTIQSISQQYQSHQQQPQLLYSNVDSPHKRHLSVWTKNCCPSNNICGVIFQDCCTLTQDNFGCYMYVFCYEKANDNDCERVKKIIKKSIGLG